MPNPLKDIWTAPQALMAPVGGLLDKIQVLQLNLDTRNISDPEKLNSSKSAMAFLKNYGFSDTMIERFFVPFFRGIFLERGLETNSSFFKFLYGQFAKGDVVVPKNGMQAIPEQIASHLSENQIRLNTAVNKIEGKTVHLENGETIEADQIVLATDANAAAKLLGEESNVEFNGTTCMYFESDSPLNLEGEPYLIVNSNSGELIDHIFTASDAVPSYAPEGKTLISVNIVGNKDVSDEKVRSELAEWFGKEYIWRHLKTYKIPEALPQYFQDSAVNNDLKINEYTFRCGDYTAYPSLNGAMKTGREVAEMLA
jgi:protoporphyrinogen oxidase